jgi:hypothetical protein
MGRRRHFKTSRDLMCAGFGRIFGKPFVTFENYEIDWLDTNALWMDDFMVC